MNEGRWILVHWYDPNLERLRKKAINLDHVIAVSDLGEQAWIDFSDGQGMSVKESFDEIGAMIR